MRNHHCLWEINVCGFCGLPLSMNLRPLQHLTSNELSYIVMQQTSYLQNYIQTNQQNFDYSQTLAPTNINDSTFSKWYS